MLLAALVASSLAVVPLVDRCRSALARVGRVPVAEFDIRLCAAVDLPAGPDEACVVLLRRGLPGAAPGLSVALSWNRHAFAAASRQTGGGLSAPPVAAVAEVPVRLAWQGVVPGGAPTSCVLLSGTVPEAVETVALSTSARPPDAERKLVSPCVAATVRDAAPRLPSVAFPEPVGLASNVLSAAVLKLVYDALADGSVNARAREWRRPLVEMLVNETPGADFDSVYGLLLRGFPGNDRRAKIRALAKWADANLPPREAADVYRAETRCWLNLGDPAMTVDAAGRMERARPDYAVRARRLSALAYATAGELEKAKAEIARSRAECWLSLRESQELLYLEAWVWLQEGRAELARRNLLAILAETPKGSIARKAGLVLQSISKEGE